MRLDWLPPLTPEACLVAGAVALVGFLVLRLAFGRPVAIARRWELLVLRSLALAILVVVLANPVRVDESPGPLEPAEVLVLVDTSESMAIGRERSRWEEAREAVRTIDAGGELARIRWLRFGERVTAVESLDDLFAEVGEGPVDPDTRLGFALRRLSSRFGRRPPASVVVVSDGRTRDRREAVEAAGHLRELGVPVHTYATGTAGVGGDVGIVSVVVPPSARKFAKVDVQVFLRSFGYEGQRADLQLWALDDAGRPERELDTVPITLASGVQSEVLEFRTELETRGLRVLVEPRADEFDTANNMLDTRLDVDRTKIRVLYVEGNGDRVYQVRVGDQLRTRGPYSDLEEALSRDPDVECVVVAVQGGALRRISTQPATRAFPGSLAELFAFDAIVLSNVPARMFTDEQVEWIEQWIEHRGGGLCMVGGESSFASGGWRGTPVERMLPVELETGTNDWDGGSTVTLAPPPGAESHPVLRIVQDARLNRTVVDSIPPFFGSNRWRGAKPGRTDVLAEANVGRGGVFGFLGAGNRAQPGLVVGRYGNGRTMALAVPITSPAAETFVNAWGEQDSRYYAKFWQNAIYWLTESSSVGRRRLVVQPDKRYYRPGETLVLDSVAYDEGARPTGEYRIVAMLEPDGSVLDLETFDSPVLWPDRLTRESGEDGAFVTWGEEFELPRRRDLPDEEGRHGIELKLGSAADLGSSAQSFRVELTAYEDVTQVDSTSVVVQVLHDPFEQQNPLPDHALLSEIAAVSGGRMLSNEASLREVLTGLPVERGAPEISEVPVWNRWWALAAVVVLLTIEWLRRRAVGLA